MRFVLAVALSTLCGFLALSYEILWLRTYSFLTESTPEAFGFLLGAYLGGLAIGAFLARARCTQQASGGADPLYALGALMLIGSVCGFFVIPLAAHAVSAWAWSKEATLLLFAAVAALLGTAMPLVSHFGIPADEKAGSRMALLYLGSIVGSAAGSLATGFLLLDWLTLRQLCVGLSLAGMSIGAALLLGTLVNRRGRFVMAPVLLASASLIAWMSPSLYEDVYEKLQWNDDYSAADAPFAQVIETKEGVVTVTDDGIIYGNGSYDGQFNTDPLPDRDRNRVARAYAVTAFHPAPRKILMIGIGSGSWLQVLANSRDVESVTVVEINPGYLEAMRASPVVASSLDHPKSEIIIDDGRRWLASTDRRFDVIIQNTIVFWRAHASNLLSREYLELTRSRLEPGGIVYLNTTSSTAAQHTAASQFPHAWRYQNMAILSDSPIGIDLERWRAALRRWTIDGVPVVDFGRHAAEVDELLSQTHWRGHPTWEDRESILRRTAGEAVITDDNMASEWWAQATFP